MKRYRVAVRQGGDQGTGIGIEEYRGHETVAIWSLYFPERMSLLNAYVLAVDMIAKEQAPTPVFFNLYDWKTANILRKRYQRENVVKIRQMRWTAEPTVPMLATDALYRRSSINEELEDGGIRV